MTEQNDTDQQLTTTVRNTDRDVVIGLVGTLDLATEPEATAAITQAITETNLPAVRIDLTDVEFIDSSGLRSLLIGYQTASDRSREFVLDIAQDGPVAKILRITALDQEFEINTH